MFSIISKSFKTRIILLVTIATFLPLTISGFFSWSMLSDQLHEIFNSRLESGLETFNIIFNNKKNDIRQGLNRIAADNTVQVTVDLKIIPQLKKYLDKQLLVLDFYSLSVYDIDMHLISQSGPYIDPVFDDIEIKEGISLEHGRLVMYQVVPVVKDSKLIAYVCGSVDLTSDRFLSQVTDSVKNSFVLYYNRQFVYSDIENSENLSSLKYFKTSSKIRIDSNRYQTKHKSWTINGQEFTFQILQSLGVMDRSLVSMTASEFVAFLLILICLLIVFRIFIREMLRPVTKLTQEAIAIEQGKLPKLELDCTRDDEFGVLNNAFVSMYDSINSYKNNLEALVDERTMEMKIAMEAAEAATIVAEQASLSKTQFLSNISHEIRTPLNCILGFSDVICNSDDLELIKENAEYVFNESKHLLSLMNMLLDHSKIEAGKMELEQIEFDLKELLKEIDTTIRPLALVKKLEFIVDTSGLTVQFVKGDPLRLRQILLNLLSNAVKFTHRGFVKLVLEEYFSLDGRVKLFGEVIDSGIGIDPEKQAEIFNSFTQADGSTTRNYGGTGLGTTISRELIELMDGKIGIESAKGRGSKFFFHVFLELSEESKSSENKSMRELNTNLESCLKILLVEDYKPNQELVRAFLKDSKHSLEIANDGIEALELLKDNKYDIVFMDIQMPRLNGFETARTIRGKEDDSANVTIIGLTASADKETVDECRYSGMNDVVTKPIIKKKFFEKLNYWGQISLHSEESAAVGSDESVMEDKVFDYERGVDQVGGDAEILLKVARLFVDTFSDNLSKIVDSLAISDFKQIAEEAHKIKGTAANIAANVLSKRAIELEKFALEEEPEKIAACIDMLENDFKEFKKQLEIY